MKKKAFTSEALNSTADVCGRFHSRENSQLGTHVESYFVNYDSNVERTKRANIFTYDGAPTAEAAPVVNQADYRPAEKTSLTSFGQQQ